MAGSKKMRKKGLVKKVISILRKYGARKIAFAKPIKNQPGTSSACLSRKLSSLKAI